VGSEPPRLDRWFARTFGDAESTRFGTGWISGVASVFLGTLALGAVMVFWFPGIFTSAEFRGLYPVALLRALLETVIGVGFLLGATSLMLRKRKTLGLTGLGLALGATLLGGGHVPIHSEFDQPLTLGLDWFLLNVFVLVLVFVPLERVFARLPEQTAFRFGWTTDGTYLLLSHVAVQVLTFLTLLPATALARVWQPQGMQAAIRGQPAWLQFLEIVLVADLTQYWIHRAFHRAPLLWRFHAVHHSSRALDWLAGSRLHVVDVIVTRGLVLVPVFLLGFSPGPLYAYLVFVSFHAVFIHANVRFRFGALEQVLATPRVHHWHHATAPVDVNFAVHLPVLDRLFGTQHLPRDQWPPAYGIGGHPVPEGWWPQLLWPLRANGTPAPGQ
jgi:lathosterol oxidase